MLLLVYRFQVMAMGGLQYFALLSAQALCQGACQIAVCFQTDLACKCRTQRLLSQGCNMSCATCARQHPSKDAQTCWQANIGFSTRPSHRFAKPPFTKSFLPASLQAHVTCYMLLQQRPILCQASKFVMLQVCQRPLSSLQLGLLLTEQLCISLHEAFPERPLLPVHLQSHFLVWHL